MSTHPCPYCKGQSRDGHVCWKCTRETKRVLRHIAELWPSLQESITRQDRLSPRSEGHAQTVYGPLPFNAEAAAVEARVRTVLVGWVRICVEELGAEWPRDTVPAMCGLITAYAPQLRKHEDGGGWAWDMAKAQGSIVHAIDLADRRALAGPCPEKTTDGEPCPGQVVVTYPIDEGQRPHMDCVEPQQGIDVCGRTWPPEMFDKMGRRILARQVQIDAQVSRARTVPIEAQIYNAPAEWIGPRNFISVADAAVIYSIPERTLRHWIRVGKLRSYPVSGPPEGSRGRPLLTVVDPQDVENRRADMVLDKALP